VNCKINTSPTHPPSHQEKKTEPKTDQKRKTPSQKSIWNNLIISPRTRSLNLSRSRLGLVVIVMGANGKISTITIILLDEISLMVPGLVNWWASAPLASGWGELGVGPKTKWLRPGMLLYVIAIGIPVHGEAGVGA